MPQEQMQSLGHISVLTALSLATASEAAPPCGGYEVEILPEIHCPGPLPDFSVQAEAINDAGMVTGHYLDFCSFGDLLDEGFIWTSRTGIVTIPRPPGVTSLAAYDISDSGLVVGRHSITGNGLGSLAFIYDGRSLSSLGTLPGGTSSEAYAVNSLDTVVGWWGNIVTGVPTAAEAFIWKDGAMVGLGAELGGNGSRAYGINDHNVVIGEIYNATGDQTTRGFVWDAGRVVILPPIPTGTSSEARGINSFGEVVGHGRLGGFGSPIRPFAYIKGRMILLSTPPETEDAFAYAISDQHLIVGRCLLTGSSAVATLWFGGEFYNLNDLIEPVPGLHLDNALSISHNGWIIAQGDLDGVGTSRTFRLRPRSPSHGDLDESGFVDVGDIAVLLEAWGPCVSASCCAGDLDRNGCINGHDLGMVLAAWGPVRP